MSGNFGGAIRPARIGGFGLSSTRSTLGSFGEGGSFAGRLLTRLVALVSSPPWDVVVVGGGASGLLCAIHAGRRGRRVLVLEQGPKCGLKILVSGGGRCNFTNIWADPEQHFISNNEHFCKSALRRYTPWDFIGMVEDHGIAYHEKTRPAVLRPQCERGASHVVARGP